MKPTLKRRPSRWPRISPWIVLAAVLGAATLAGLMFSRDYRREQGYLKEMFLQRGEVLIHSLELVGRFRLGVWEEQLAAFWGNLEEGDNVVFLALTDEQGQVLALAGDAPADFSVFREPRAEPFSGGPIAPDYRVEKVGGQWLFLVYRPFWPQAREPWHHEAGQKKKRVRPEKGTQPPPPPPDWRQWPRRYLWVAFNMGPFEKASQSRVRTAAFFIGLFCLAGLAGVLALIWGHNSRLARQLYQDTNALAAELIGRLPVGVVLLDGGGRVTLVNRAALDMTGLKEKAFLGRTLRELTYGLFPEESVLAGREMRLGFAGGQTVTAALTSGPVISDDGHPLGQIILMEDLGEVGRLKSELAKQERLATLGGMAAGLAHEIRNPLGAIRGLSQHLLSRQPADSPDREALEVVLASVDRLGDTITDFLDYARPAQVKPEPLDLAQLVRQMAVLAGHDARSRAVELTLDLPEAPAIVSGDEAHLSRAFLNLYLNAIEAAGGRPGGGGRLEVALKVRDRRAALTFRDNGPGFSPEQLAQPFVPYFTTKAEGTGLGLAMVAKSIRAHQGADISLASPPDGGGLVTISFDLDEETRDEPEPQSPDLDS